MSTPAIMESFTSRSSSDHLPHPGSVGRIGLHQKIFAEGGLCLAVAAFLEKRDPVPAPRIRGSIGIDDRRGVALRRAHIVSATVSKPPHLALIEAEQSVPPV